MLGQGRVGAVDRRRRRHDHVRAAGPAGRLEHLERAGGVGVVAGHRVGERPRHRRPGGQVHDGDGAGEGLVEGVASRMLPSTSVASTPSRLARSPVDRSSRATTSSPRSAAARARQRLAPMKPAPPVTTTFITSFLVLGRSRPLVALGRGCVHRPRDPTRGSSEARWTPCTVRRCPSPALPDAADVSRIYLSPPDVGPGRARGAARRVRLRLDRPGRPRRRRVRAGARRRRPAPATPPRCRAAPPPCTSPCWPPGSARATRCSCRRSRSSPRPTRWSTSAPSPCSSTATRTPGTSIPSLVADELDERAAPGPAAGRGDRRRPLRPVRRRRRARRGCAAATACR